MIQNILLFSFSLFQFSDLGKMIEDSSRIYKVIEITKSKNFPTVTRNTDGARMTVHSVLLHKAIVGDNEDISYAQFVISGITKKKSSTFKISGLTGSTNGHFGGVESKTSTTWLRQKEQK